MAEVERVIAVEHVGRDDDRDRAARAVRALVRRISVRLLQIGEPVRPGRRIAVVRRVRPARDALGVDVLHQRGEAERRTEARERLRQRRRAVDAERRARVALHAAPARLHVTEVHVERALDRRLVRRGEDGLRRRARLESHAAQRGNRSLHILRGRPVGRAELVGRQEVVVVRRRPVALAVDQRVELLAVAQRQVHRDHHAAHRGLRNAGHRVRRERAGRSRSGWNGVRAATACGRERRQKRSYREPEKESLHPTTSDHVRERT